MYTRVLKNPWGVRMGEKYDVIDLIINVLKEHEKRLDKICRRLEEVADKLEKYTRA